MFRRATALIAVVCLLTVVPASADVVVLRNGERHEGTVANREQVRQDPAGRSLVALLLPGGDELIRFATEDINHVIIEDGGNSCVLDFMGVDLEILEERGRAMRVQLSPRPSGIPIIVGGLLVGGVGALVKLGEEELRVTEDSAELRPTYNAFNYTMIIGGTGMVVVGIAMEVSRRQHPPGDGLRVSLITCPTPIDGTPGLAIVCNF